MDRPVNRRRYDATSRRESSSLTRRRILDAALTGIIESGYRATTVRSIAASAGVSVATVYELVGRKADIVRELIELALSGEDRPVAGADRPYAAAMRAEPDAGSKLALYAAAVTEIQGRLAPLVIALRDAAGGDPAAAEAWAEVSRRRATNMGRIAAELGATGELRSELGVNDVADTLWALNSPELYLLLTTDRGWSPERFRTWLADVWQRTLLDKHAGGGSATGTPPPPA